MHAAWQWFLAHGGLDALVFSTVSGALGLLGRAILHELRHVKGLLDTHTAGGLHDVVTAVHELERGRGKEARSDGH